MTLEQQLTRGPARAARARLGLRCGCLVAKAVRLRGGGDAAVSTCMRGRLPTGLRARSTPHRVRQRLACVRAPRRRSWNFWPRGTRGERIPPGTLHAIGARASVSTAMAGGWDRTCMQSRPACRLGLGSDRRHPSPNLHAIKASGTQPRSACNQGLRHPSGTQPRSSPPKRRSRHSNSGPAGGPPDGTRERSICAELGDNLGDNLAPQ